MTEAKVPISTATEAGSIQLSFCRAITNTFSAGGNDAINTAVAAQGCANGPEQQHQSEHDKRMDQEFDGDDARNLPGHPAERAKRHRHA